MAIDSLLSMVWPGLYEGIANIINASVDHRYYLWYDTVYCVSQIFRVHFNLAFDKISDKITKF